MHELIRNRWSARGYDPQATISEDSLIAILEAGRWAPTWGSVQPVRVIVGTRGDETFDGLVTALTRGNASWAPAAAALILVCTRVLEDDEKASTYAVFDAGLATSQMILQANAEGFNAHPMAGFEIDTVVETFSIPAEQAPIALIAVGKLAPRETLDPSIAERDDRERTRLPLSETAFAGSWGMPYRADPPA